VFFLQQQGQRVARGAPGSAGELFFEFQRRGRGIGNRGEGSVLTLQAHQKNPKLLEELPPGTTADLTS